MNTTNYTIEDKAVYLQQNQTTMKSMIDKKVKQLKKVRRKRNKFHLAR
jgi:hypothetical protein